MVRGVLWYKIRSDLLGNLGRTLQVILIITIGSTAIGSIIGATQFIRQDVLTNWLGIRPAAVVFTLGKQGVSQELIESLEKSPEIDQVEGQLRTTIRWRRSPAEPWQRANLHAREDYEAMKLYVLKLEEGDWPRNKVMTVNRGYGIKTGDRIYLDIDGKERLVEIGGITLRINAPPPNFGGRPTFYATKEYFAELTGTSDHRYIAASVPGEYTEAKARRAAQYIEDRLSGQNVEVYPGTFENTKITVPERHPAQGPIDGIFFILEVMAFASLILGLFLVFNTITTVLNQQIPQIGVLKAIGATRTQILLFYYTTVLIYGLCAIVFSIPLGAIGAHGLRVFMIEFLNMDVGPFGLSARAIIIQVVICILSPLLIATIPIFRGAGITVYQAMITYGLTGGGDWLNRLLAKSPGIPLLLSIAVNNFLRNKLRLCLTQISLVVAGMLFIAVMSTQASIRFTYRDLLFKTFKANIILDFDDKERFRTIERVLRQADPEISTIEMWATVRADVRPAGQPASFDDQNIQVTGMPIPSSIYQPQVQAGRWLEPGDTHALVMHQHEAAKLGITVGDWVTLDIPLAPLAEKTQWQVVGLLIDPLDESRVVAPRETLLLEDHGVGRADNLFIKTTNGDPQLDIALAAELRNMLNRHGYKLIASSNTDTIQLTSDKAISELNIVIYLLLIMALVIALVGGVALSGILAISVLERRVEIGIMRAIGASNRRIASIFIGEGVLMGWLSWLIAIPFSIPVSIGLNAAVGLALGNELVFHYAAFSIWLWLIIITLLAVAASWFPAKGAIRLSVRECLAYQ